MIDATFKEGYKIQRPTTTNNNGLVEKTYTDVATISCRVRQLSGNEAIAAEKMGYTANYRIYCLATDVEEQDRIIGLNDEIYEVKNVNNVMDMGQLFHVDCELKK